MLGCPGKLPAQDPEHSRRRRHRPPRSKSRQSSGRRSLRSEIRMRDAESRPAEPRETRAPERQAERPQRRATRSHPMTMAGRCDEAVTVCGGIQSYACTGDRCKHRQHE